MAATSLNVETPEPRHPSAQNRADVVFGRDHLVVDRLFVELSGRMNRLPAFPEGVLHGWNRVCPTNGTPSGHRFPTLVSRPDEQSGTNRLPGGAGARRRDGGTRSLAWELSSTGLN